VIATDSSHCIYALPSIESSISSAAIRRLNDTLIDRRTESITTACSGPWFRSRRRSEERVPKDSCRSLLAQPNPWAGRHDRYGWFEIACRRPHAESAGTRLSTPGRKRPRFPEALARLDSVPGARVARIREGEFLQCRNGTPRRDKAEAARLLRLPAADYRADTPKPGGKCRAAARRPWCPERVLHAD
jgi:hypothetical protein